MRMCRFVCSGRRDAELLAVSAHSLSDLPSLVSWGAFGCVLLKLEVLVFKCEYFRGKSV